MKTKRIWITVTGIVLTPCVVWLASLASVYYDAHNATESVISALLLMLIGMTTFVAIVFAAYGFKVFCEVRGFDTYCEPIFVGKHDVVDIAVFAVIANMCFAFIFGLGATPFAGRCFRSSWMTFWNIFLFLAVFPPLVVARDIIVDAINSRRQCDS